MEGKNKMLSIIYLAQYYDMLEKHFTNKMDPEPFAKGLENIKEFSTKSRAHKIMFDTWMDYVYKHGPIPCKPGDFK